MIYSKFESIISSPRMNRYLYACDGDTRRAMTLYRKNLKLSQEMFTIISCFEVALRNAINEHYVKSQGDNWLQEAAQPGGMFDNSQCLLTKKAINDGIRKLRRTYTHSKLVAELGFGFWRYMFANNQFRMAGQTLLTILPNKPVSSRATNYNANYMFNFLKDLNIYRNRIAHHDPICFQVGDSVIDITHTNDSYQKIVSFFQWMNIDESDFLFGLDHVNQVMDEVKNV